MLDRPCGNLFIVTPVAAQKTFGRISGTVTDQTNAGVPGAKGAF
jgi:hypothetical protein